MANNNKLKAYVRFDGSGRVVPGSLVLQRSKPKVGKWKEVEYISNSGSFLLTEVGDSLTTENNNNIII